MANDHYITKAYLDKFVHPGSKDKVLFPYARGDRIPKAAGKGTKKLGSAESFYAQKENGEWHNKLDDARKFVESIVFASGKRTSGPLAKCVYDDDFSPTAEHRPILAGAAAFLHTGSPVQIHNTAMFGLFACQAHALNQLNTVDAKDLYTEAYGDDWEKKIQEDRVALLKGELVVDVGEENWKQLGFEAMQLQEMWINVLSKMGLTICGSHYQSFFITSDNPVVVHCGSQPNNPGIGVKDAEIWFPISYKKGLLWTWKHRGVQRDTFGHSLTRTMNKRMIKWCYKEVYSPLAEDWIGRAMKEVQFDPCYGHYGSLQEMIDNYALTAILPNGTQAGEIMDITAGLKSGEKHDVVGI